MELVRHAALEPVLPHRDVDRRLIGTVLKVRLETIDKLAHSIVVQLSVVEYAPLRSLWWRKNIDRQEAETCFALFRPYFGFVELVERRRVASELLHVLWNRLCFLFSSSCQFSSARLFNSPLTLALGGI